MGFGSTSVDRPNRFAVPGQSPAGAALAMTSIVMADGNHSQFVREVAAEFFRRYSVPVAQKPKPDGLWIECQSSHSSKFRSALTLGISETCLTVAFEGRTDPKLIRPGRKDASTIRREAFDLFDDLITERQVAISFWQGDECIGIEFIPAEQIASKRGSWSDYSSRIGFRVRSWLGTYNEDPLPPDGPRNQPAGNAVI